MERAVKKYIFWGAGTHGRLAVEKFGQVLLIRIRQVNFVDIQY